MGASGLGGGHARRRGGERAETRVGHKAPPGSAGTTHPPASALRAAGWAPRRPLQTVAHTLGTWPPQALFPPRPGLETPQRAWGSRRQKGDLWPAASRDPLRLE